ncbi:MAG: hypothetical protein R8F63_00740 [Acidimicrobiales bacterium]|nr:hypothetical protein [Acidimicrobiales bacterium]
MRYTISITVELPDGATVEEVKVEPSDDTPLGARPMTGPSVLSDAVAKRVTTIAPRDQAEHIRDYLERVSTELGVSIELPDGKRIDYLNLYPPAGHRRRRAASVTLTSGRTEIYCDPGHSEGRSHAEPDTHNGVPVQLKIYLDSAAAVAEAAVLTEIAIDENRR